jgi:hypothetical protein
MAQRAREPVGEERIVFDNQYTHCFEIVLQSGLSAEMRANTRALRKIHVSLGC